MAKDALLVIDDFAPQGSSIDVARYHAAADRVFRAAGNHAGRGRLDSTAKLREPKPPRALILSTGEDIPRGQSVRARLMILEIAKAPSKPATSPSAREMHRPVCTPKPWAASCNGLPDATRMCGPPSTGRSLSIDPAPWQMWLMPARRISSRIYKRPSSCTWISPFMSALSRQPNETPWQSLLGSTIRSSGGTGETPNRDGTRGAIPDPVALVALRPGGRTWQGATAANRSESPECCGWRRDSSGNWIPLGDCIGWVDDDDVYLEPTAAYRAVQIGGARHAARLLAVSEQTLKKRLHEKGLLASVDASAPDADGAANASADRPRAVLHFLRSTILPEASDADEDAE